MEGYCFYKVLPLNNYGMDFRFSGNNWKNMNDVWDNPVIHVVTEEVPVYEG